MEEGMSAMEEENEVPFYAVLGSSHPQRDSVILQLAEYLLEEVDQVWISAEDAAIEAHAQWSRLEAKGLRLSLWSLDPGKAFFTAPPSTSGGKVAVLWVGPGAKRLVDAIEALSLWLPGSGHALQRVITWVDAMCYESGKHAQNWYQCCFQFSDLVLLDEFRELPASWMKDFRLRMHRACYPFIIENTRKGMIHDPFLLLDSQVRRISQVFEIEALLPDIEWEEVGSESDDEDEEEDGPYVETYFERLVDGKRSNPVADLIV
jgi:hypothetical protein